VIHLAHISVTTSHSPCILVVLGPCLKYVYKKGRYQAFEGGYPPLFRSTAYLASIIYNFGTHHCPDFLHILPAQSTTLDHPHIPSHIYISAVIIIQQSSHQVISLYILWIISRASTARDCFARSTTVIKEALSLYISWIISRASTARDYFARSTTVIKNYHCTFLG
jgi:hypothetical protein